MNSLHVIRKYEALDATITASGTRHPASTRIWDLITDIEHGDPVLGQQLTAALFEMHRHWEIKMLTRLRDEGRLVERPEHLRRRGDA